MSNTLLTDNQYKSFIEDIKNKIKSSSQKAVRVVNSELINLYFEIGKDIVDKQSGAKWGDNFLKQVESDLRLEFPNLKGFSQRNLIYMRSMYKFCNVHEISPQAVAQLPWGHIRLLVDKIKDKNEALFYINQSTQGSWSRTVLDWQIGLGLYKRKGNSINNFEITETTELQTNLVKESFKESYVLDFLELDNDRKERKLENSIVSNITRFMLELGKGFAYVGRQYKLQVGQEEFYTDLLFYNFVLKRFVIIELKTTNFKPSYISQLNFYMTAIDKDVKAENDKETIGLLICKGADKTVVEYALNGSNMPTAVASLQLPEDIQNNLPDEAEIVHGLSKILDNPDRIDQNDTP
jgi:predicted nuclease of restriction endonuclease-like (RecB) superfamily